MEGYLGEFDIDLESSPFKNYAPFDWAMYFVEKYGQKDGERHKAWVLDQVARIYNGTLPIVKIAKWSNGQSEYRVNLDSPSEKYELWVGKMKDGEDGAETYFYDKGVAP